MPPTLDQARQLIRHLQEQNLQPVVVGSVAVFDRLHLRDSEFRPTHDLDIFVLRRGPLPAGWTEATTSSGVAAAISPTGGRVDFLEQLSAADYDATTVVNCRQFGTSRCRLVP